MGSKNSKETEKYCYSHHVSMVPKKEPNWICFPKIVYYCPMCALVPRYTKLTNSPREEGTQT